MKIGSLQFRNPFYRYGFALAMAALSILLRFALMPFLETGYRYITIYPAIIIVAIFAGRGPAIITSVLGAVLAEYYFTPELVISDIPALSIIILTGTLAGWLAQGLRGALAQSEEKSAALAESEQRLQQRSTVDEAIMANMGEGLYTLDTNGMVTYVNPMAEHLLGFSSAELIGRKMHEMIHYQHPDGTPYPIEECASMQVLTKGKAISGHEDVFIRKGGEFFPVVYSSSPIQVDGRTVGLVAVFRDVSAQKLFEEKLRESESRFRTLFESIDEGFCVVEVLFNENRRAIDYRFLEINPAFERQTGLHDALGKTMRELRPKHEEYWFETYGKIALTGEPARFQNRAEQLHRWYDVYAFRYGKPENHQVAILFDDITERKRTEDELKESEEKFRLLAENANAMIGIIQGEHFVYVNPYGERLSGYTREEICNIKFWEVVHPDFRAIIIDRAKRRLAGEAVVSPYEFALLTKSGETRWLDFSPVRFFYKGQPAILGIAFDITERKRTQEALRQSELFYRETLESIPGMVFTTRPDGYYDYQSSQWVEFTGVPMEQMLGDGWNKLLHPDDQGRVFAAWRAAVEERAPYDLEYRVRRHDGEYEWFKVHAHPIRNGSAKIVRWFGVAANINNLKKTEEELKESEEKFRLLAENAQAIIGILQGEKIIYCNPYSQRISGYSREELLNIDLRKLIHPDYLPIMLERAAKRQRGEPVESHYEFEFLTKQGETKWADFSPIMIMYRGKPAIIAIAFDITERKRIEEELRESEEKFRMLAENAGAIIGIVQGEKIIYANPYSEAATGYSRQELYEVGFPKLVHPAYRNMMIDRAQRRQRGEPVESHYEFIMVRKDGQERWVDFSPIMIIYRGKPAIIGIAFDITDRKRAEEAVLESEEKFRLLAENARALIGIVQGEKFVYVNPYMEEMTEYSREECLQMPVGQLIHPDHRSMVLESSRKRQAGERVESHYEFAIKTKSHEKRYVDFSGTGINYKGKAAIVWIAVDITERKHAEEQIREIKEQVEQKNKELETIIRIVSHDLRAPLVNVRGFGNEIARDCKSLHTLFSGVVTPGKVRQELDMILHESIPESLRFIQSSAEAMNNLVATLVEVARAGFAPVKAERLDINELITKVMESIRIKFKDANVVFSIEKMPECIADRTQVTQIFTNLLDNAVKYLDPDRRGQICVGGEIEAGTAVYWVADNGIGIAPKDQEKIFDPYYQLKEKAAGGMGLGLATVKRMLDRNSGKIWVVSEKGKGAKFYVALPAAS